MSNITIVSKQLEGATKKGNFKEATISGQFNNSCSNLAASSDSDCNKSASSNDVYRNRSAFLAMAPVQKVTTKKSSC